MFAFLTQVNKELNWEKHCPRHTLLETTLFFLFFLIKFTILIPGFYTNKELIHNYLFFTSQGEIASVLVAVPCIQLNQ